MHEQVFAFAASRQAGTHLDVTTTIGKLAGLNHPKGNAMRLAKLNALCLLAIVIASGTPAEAYVGPGLGAGMIAVVLGILAAVVMAFASIVWFPIKRRLRKRTAAKKDSNTQ